MEWGVEGRESERAGPCLTLTAVGGVGLLDFLIEISFVFPETFFKHPVPKHPRTKPRIFKINSHSFFRRVNHNLPRKRLELVQI